MGAEDSGVEPWGKLVEGGLEGCERGSIMEESREIHEGGGKSGWWLEVDGDGGGG